MAYPDLVAKMIEAMKKETNKPITVKRIGIDGQYFAQLLAKSCYWINTRSVPFCENPYEVGINHFIIHARIAILEGLSLRKTEKFTLGMRRFIG